MPLLSNRMELKRVIFAGRRGWLGGGQMGKE